MLHELWHISPDFDGDIRRHAGRYHAHTHSQAEYDDEMGLLADRWLALSRRKSCGAFCGTTFAHCCRGTADRRPADSAGRCLVPVE